MDDRSRIERFRAFRRANPIDEALGEAWTEHRRYVGFSLGLFVFGMVLGAVLLLAGVNFLEMILEMFDEAIEDDFEPDTAFYVVNNSRVFLLAIGGAITLGLLTVFTLVFNGFIIGQLGLAMSLVAGPDVFVVGVFTHGVFELFAFFVAAGVGFRLLHRFVQRVRGTRESFVTKTYLYRTALFVFVGWLLLVLAAVIEANVTPPLLEFLFEARLDELSEEADVASAALGGVLAESGILQRT